MGRFHVLRYNSTPVAVREIQQAEQDGGGQPLPAPLSAEPWRSLIASTPFPRRLPLVAVPHL